MDTEDVPQDHSSTYAGHNKLLYARRRSGGYTAVKSSGWHAEEMATCDAVHEYERLAEEALQMARAEQASPLYFHMYRCRMDPALLSQVTRIFRWRVKRHFRANIFRKLSEPTLHRYAQALDMSVDELKQLPGQRP
jgi:hypothetical protein